MVQAVALLAAVQAVAAMLVVVEAAVVAVEGVVLLMVVLVQLLSPHLRHMVLDVVLDLGRLAGRALCMLRPAAVLWRYVAGCGGSCTQMVRSQITALSVKTMRAVFVIVA